MYGRENNGDRIEESDQTSSNIRASSISGSTLNTDKDKKHFNEPEEEKEIFKDLSAEGIPGIKSSDYYELIAENTLSISKKLSNTDSNFTTNKKMNLNQHNLETVRIEKSLKSQNLKENDFNEKESITKGEISMSNIDEEEELKTSSQSSNIFQNNNTKQRRLNFEIDFIYFDDLDNFSHKNKNDHNECNSEYGGNISDKMSCKPLMAYKPFSEISEKEISLRNDNYDYAKRVEEEQSFDDQDDEETKEERIENYETVFPTDNESGSNIDPIQFYTFKTKRAGGLSTNRKACQLNEFEYLLYLDRKEDKEIVELSSRLKRLPAIKYLYFEYVKPEDKNVKDFLLNFAPLRLEKLVFGGAYSKQYGYELLRIDYYSIVLDNVLKATTKEAEFYDCNITSYELQQMFIAACDIEKLSFNNCMLDIDEDFDIEEDFENEDIIFCIKYIELCDCGTATASDWNAHPEGLNRLVKAIANSGMKYSIEKIYVIDSTLDVKQVKDIFYSNGMKEKLII